MAEWKGQQFAKYLEAKRKELKNKKYKNGSKRIY